MAFDVLQTLDVMEAMPARMTRSDGENFIARKRPPEHIRPQLDIGYKIDGQSIYVLEIRPQWDKPEIIKEYPVAKAPFVKTKNHWKVYWMRANLQWHSYSPKPAVKTIAAFTKLVEDDTYHCFWG